MTRRGYGGRLCLATSIRIAVVSLVLLGLSTAARSQQIRVKVLDARTGRPVTYETAQLDVETYKEGFLTAPAHNNEGTAEFFYSGHSIRPIWPPNTQLRYSWMRELPIQLPPDVGKNCRRSHGSC